MAEEAANLYWNMKATYILPVMQSLLPVIVFAVGWELMGILVRFGRKFLVTRIVPRFDLGDGSGGSGPQVARTRATASKKSGKEG